MAFCAGRDGNASAGCVTVSSLCAVSDPPPFASGNAASAALAVVADAGGAFTCASLSVTPVGHDFTNTFVLLMTLILGLGLLFCWLTSVLFRCVTLYPARLPPLGDAQDLHEWTRAPREAARALRHSLSSQGSSSLLQPPTQLSWADAARLDAERLRSEEEAAARRKAAGEARLVDLALLGEWEDLQNWLLDADKQDAKRAPLERGAFGWLPLHHAARRGAPVEVLQVLLEYGPGAVDAYTSDALDGFAPVARATDVQLLLLVSLCAAAVCVVPVAVALSRSRPALPLSEGAVAGVCVATVCTAYTLAFVCLFALFPVSFTFYTIEAPCLLFRHVDREERAKAALAGPAAARAAALHRAVAALDAWLPEKLKARAWVSPAATRTPLGVAADALHRALLAHSPDASRFVDVVRALAFAAPHTLLRTRLVNELFGLALLRDVILSDHTLLWRPFNAEGTARTLTQLAVAAYTERHHASCCRRETQLDAPDVETLFTLLDLHVLFGVPAPQELDDVIAEPKAVPGCGCGCISCGPSTIFDDFNTYQRRLDIIQEACAIVQDASYTIACAPVLYAAPVPGAPEQGKVRLGAGGFAEVFVYRRPHGGEPEPGGAEKVRWEQAYTPGVAVKVYSAEATRDLDEHAAEEEEGRTLATAAPAGGVDGAAAASGARIAALLNETLLLRMMDHPNVIRFLDAKAASGRLELYMQLAPGGDLSSAFRTAPHAVRWRAEGARLAAEAAQGLRYLHEQHKQAHRDIKPSNLLLSAPLPGGRVMLADFGISVHMARSRAADSACTLVWAAPEIKQALFKRDIIPEDFYQVADIYSLGLIIRKLITGCIDTDPVHKLKCPLCVKSGVLEAQRSPHMSDGNVSRSDAERLAALAANADAAAAEMRCRPCGFAACSLAAAALACAATQVAPGARPSLARVCVCLAACASRETRPAAGVAAGAGSPWSAAAAEGSATLPLLDHVTIELAPER